MKDIPRAEPNEKEILVKVSVCGVCHTVLDKAEGRLEVPQLQYDTYLWYEKEIKSVANVTKADAEEFLPIAAEIGISPTIEEFPLEDANDVLVKIKHSQLKAAAVLRV